jgi:hypothetical protein
MKVAAGIGSQRACESGPEVALIIAREGPKKADSEEGELETGVEELLGIGMRKPSATAARRFMIRRSR